MRRASSGDQGRGSDQDQDAVPISGSDNPRTLARRRSPPAGRLRSQLHAGQNHGTSMTPATASGRIGGKVCARLARRSTRPTATGRSLERGGTPGTPARRTSTERTSRRGMPTITARTLPRRPPARRCGLRDARGAVHIVGLQPN